MELHRASLMVLATSGVSLEGLDAKIGVRSFDMRALKN